MANFSLVVDTRDLQDLIDEKKQQLSPEGFEKMMGYVMSDLARNARVKIRKAVQTEYDAKTEWIYRGIKTPRIGHSGVDGASCTIPLSGQRGNIGSTLATRKGTGHPGWNPPKYKIKFKEMKGKWSVLPPKMANQGGNPPFVNTAAPTLHNLVFTRTGRKTDSGKDQLQRVSGLALPQMPLNRARGETEKELLDYAAQRVEHHFSRILERER